VVLGRYIVDFCCFKGKLIIELDGGQHAEQMERDERRTVELQAMGFRVLRFWDRDVFKETAIVLKKLEEALWKPPSPPLRGTSPTQPTPLGGEGRITTSSDIQR
jgi:very-short-patch-repair endonuclease